MYGVAAARAANLPVPSWAALAEAVGLAPGNEEPADRCEAICGVATAYAHAGRLEKAKRSFAEALAALGDQPCADFCQLNGRRDERRTPRSPRRQVRAGLPAEAAATAREIPFSGERAASLVAAAEAHATAGEIDKARQICAEALDAACRMNNVEGRTSVFQQVATIQAVKGLFADALATARSIPSARLAEQRCA